MPRGIAWDYLPNPFNRYRGQRNNDSKTYMNYYIPPVIDDPTNASSNDNLIEENSVLKDMKEIGKTIGFGIVVGSLTGLMFGTINALRDTTSMTGRNTVGTKKILQTAGYFGT